MSAALAPRAPAGRTVRVAVAGCGVVGGALLELLRRQTEAAGVGAASGFRLTRILVRDAAKAREAAVPRSLVTSDLEEFLGTDADVVVEAIGGIEPATRIATETLRRGATLVTANKALLATAGGELSRLARRGGGRLRFDAAVGGGVPVLRLIGDALGGSAPAAVRGILNGTSNFVLTAMERGASLDDALADARARGFAELDATRDLDGRDAADKIAIVAWVAFGVDPESVIVRRRGLDGGAERLVRLAAAIGGRLRLVAECVATDGGRSLVASVEPIVVGADSALGRTIHEENRVEVHAGWSAPLALSGPGAGGVPTATSLLSDLLAPDVERMPRGATPLPVADERELWWAVGATLPPDEFVQALGDAGLPELRITSSGGGHGAAADPSSSGVIGPVPWRIVERAYRRLELRGVQPVVARVDEGIAIGGAR